MTMLEHLVRRSIVIVDLQFPQLFQTRECPVHGVLCNTQADTSSRVSIYAGQILASSSGI